MKDRSGRNSWVYIAAMSDERARKVIEQSVIFPLMFPVL
jgi:hypothetical protein